MPQPPRRPSIIAHHLIWTLYGHWLPNDPRGSGSHSVEQTKLRPLGPVHHGRKPPRMQPSRGELREFYSRANPLLSFEPCWLGERHRADLGLAIGAAINSYGYTVWACAILKNHAHLVIRKHRDDALVMWNAIADATRQPLVNSAKLDPAHPVWAERPYKVFLCTPERVRDCIRYVEQNPVKEGLPAQSFPFVKAYDGWPFHRQ